MFTEGLLKGKRILVTGGGTGLGKEIATRYLSLGAEVWIAGRRGQTLEATARELMAAHGGTVRTHAVDIRDAQAVDAMVEHIWTQSGPLSGLVNNAAGNFISPTKDLTPNGFNAIANTVFHGTFYVTHAVGKRWIAGGHRGSVVTILVTWVWTGSPYVVPSAMSKAGLHVMTKSLAVEWGRYGIRLNAIAPGAFPTEGASKRLRPDGKFEDGNEKNPMRRIGAMPEVQNLATFLMADGCEWLTGETIAIDGGGYLANGGSFSELDKLSDTDWERMRALIKAQNEKDRAGQHGLSAHKMAQIVPRPAATLILLRDAAQGPEIFMLKRSPSAAFVANAYVFPGGGLDAADHKALDRVRGLTEAEANRRLGVDAGGLAYWVAAVRECFEEAGILIAVDESGAPLDPARADALAVHRAAVNAGTLAFGEFLEREKLAIPAQSIAYFSHWITAPGRPRRFTARFFVARSPVGQHGSHDDGETVASEWVRPQMALDRCAKGEIELVHPTRISLTELAPFGTASAAFDFASSRIDIEADASCWADGKDGRKLFRRNDPPYAEIHWSDPEEAGDTSYDLVPGTAKRLDRFVTRVIAPNPGVMTGPGTNAYLVGGDELALIDPGPAIDSHVDALLAAGAGRIKWVLCTHTHMDHSPAARRIREATGAIVMGRPAPRGGSQDQAFAPDRVLKHGERIQCGAVKLRAIHTPGHASNHLCYLLEETRMLFTGDHVMQGSTVVINPPDGDMRAYLASLEMLLAEDIAVFAPGHGYLIGRPHKEVARLVAHRMGREAKVIAAMQKLGPATVEELVPAVYDDVSPKLYPVAARSLCAHLDKLGADERAVAQDGRWRLTRC